MVVVKSILFETFFGTDDFNGLAVANRVAKLLRENRLRRYLNRMHEWELHLNGAIDNGASKAEIRVIIHLIAIYRGAPAALACLRIAKRVLEDKSG